jgi:predicted NUDIX family phosphoesterase
LVEPLKLTLKAQPKPSDNATPASSEEKLLLRMQVIEEKQDAKAEALKKIAEYLDLINSSQSEIEQLELEVLHLLKKKLEQM